MRKNKLKLEMKLMKMKVTMRVKRMILPKMMKQRLSAVMGTVMLKMTMIQLPAKVIMELMRHLSRFH